MIGSILMYLNWTTTFSLELTHDSLSIIPVCLSIHILNCLSIYPHTHLSIYPSTYSPVYQYIHILTYLSTYLPTYLSFKDRGYLLTVQLASDKTNQLFSLGKRQSDHLLLLTPKSQSTLQFINKSYDQLFTTSFFWSYIGFGGDISVASIIQHLNAGGNVLATTSTHGSDFIKDLGIEFSIDFDVFNPLSFKFQN